MDDDSARRADEYAGQACPHVNRNDPRCASRFCLGRIDQAFHVCFGSYRGCPMYHRINREIDRAGAPPDRIPLITMTAHGSPLHLRRTGT